MTVKILPRRYDMVRGLGFSFDDIALVMQLSAESVDVLVNKLMDSGPQIMDQYRYIFSFCDLFFYCLCSHPLVC